jgi:hypothetical protein
LSPERLLAPSLEKIMLYRGGKGMRENIRKDLVTHFGDNSLIVGRIVAAHAREDYLLASERDDQGLIHASPLLAYLNPGRYASIGESYSFPFPAGFTR